MTEQPTTPPGPEQPEQQSGPQQGQPMPTPAPATAPKRLLRSKSDRMVGGVCGGVAEYFGIDSTLLRILVVVGTVVGFGSLLLAYIIGWIFIPEAD